MFSSSDFEPEEVDTDVLGLNRVFTQAAPSNQAKSEDENMSEAESDADAVKETPVNLDGDFSFKPLFICGMWENAEEEKRVSVAILLPSGVGDARGDHDLRVVGDGMFLEISVVWPLAMVDLQLLHQFWLAREKDCFLPNHPRLLSFRPFLRNLRPTSDTPIISSYKIRLPIQVKNELAILKRNKNYLKWGNSGMRVLYVTLEAPDTNYALSEDDMPVFLDGGK